MQKFIRILHLIFFLSLFSLFTACSIIPIKINENIKENIKENPIKFIEQKMTFRTKILWISSIGNGWEFGFAPAVVNDIVYAATPDGSLARFNLINGEINWKIETQKHLSAGVGTNDDGSIVIVASLSGEIFAFDDTGKFKWKSQANGSVTIPPIIRNEIVITRSSNYCIQAFDLHNGENLWNFQRPCSNLILHTYFGMIIKDNLIITGLSGGSLIALDIFDGTTKWEKTVSVPSGNTDIDYLVDIVGTPQVYENILCTLSYPGNIACFDLSNFGKVIWNYKSPGLVNIDLDRNFVFSTDQYGIIKSFNIKDNQLVWNQNILSGHKIVVEPIVFNDILVIGNSKGCLYFFDCNNGNLISSIQIDRSSISSPFIPTSQGLIFQTKKGDLILLHISKNF